MNLRWKHQTSLRVDLSHKWHELKAEIFYLIVGIRFIRKNTATIVKARIDLVIGKKLTFTGYLR